jgi:hypothetical protein
MSWSSSNNQGKDFTPGKFKSMRGDVRDTLTAGAQGRGVAVDPFQGELVAGIAPGEQSQLGRIGGFAADEDANFRASQQSLRAIAGGSQLDFQNDPAFQKILDFSQRRLAGGFNQREEEIKALFARAGQELPNSSPFAESQSRIFESRTQAATDLEAQLIGQEFGAARDRQMLAGTQLSNLETQRLERALSTLEANGLPRLIRDMGLERGREEFARRQDQILKLIGLQTEAASPHLAGTGKSSSVSIL